MTTTTTNRFDRPFSASTLLISMLVAVLVAALPPGAIALAQSGDSVTPPVTPAAAPAETPAAAVPVPPPVTPPVAPAPPPSPTTELTAESVAAQIRQIETDTAMEEAFKAKLLESYRLAAVQLEAAVAFQARAAALKQQIETSPQRLEELRAGLESNPLITDGASSIPEALTGDEMSRQLAQDQAEAAALKSRLLELETQLKELAGRPPKVREEMAAAKLKLETIEKDLQLAAPAEEPAPLTAARRAALMARQRARTSEIASLDQALVGYDTRLALMTMERDLVARQSANADTRLKAFQDEVNRRKRAEAETARLEAERAQRDAIGKHETVKAIADDNAESSRALTEVVGQTQQAAAEQATISEQLKQLDQQIQDAKNKLEIAGLSQTLGHILREQRKRLPNIKKYERTAAERSERLVEVGLKKIDVDEERRGLIDVEQAVQTRMLEMDAALSESDRAAIEEELRKLLTTRKELLDKLGPAYASLVNALGDLDFEHRQLIDKSADYSQFLDERLLWIPSAPAISMTTLKRVDDDVAWLLSPANWTELLTTLRTNALDEPVLPALLLLLFGSLLILRRWLRARCAVMAQSVGKIKVDGLSLTFVTLLNVLLIALPWPLLLGYIGWTLREDFLASVFVRGVGHGLLITAILLYAILSLAGFCDKGGLAEVHLRWSKHATAVIRRQLLWLRLVAPPLVFAITFTEWQSDDSHQAGFGRLAFVVVMIAFTVFVMRVLHPSSGALGPALQRRKNSVLARLRFVWYGVSVGIPLALAVLAAVGYYYTAQQLEQRLLVTASVIFVSIIVHDLVVRALALARTKLAIKQAKEKRAALASAQKAAGAAGADESDVAIPVEIPTIDLAAVDEQTRHFLRGVIGVSLIVALWAAWADVLPALAILDQIELWQRSVVIDGELTSIPITLKNLGLTILIIVLTVIAARNLPGAMDMIVLGRLPIDAGTRYAVSSISRYAIVAVGIVLSSSKVGFGWPQVQWLLAALTVGLGFGLQEIFANFVSGLIILIERPIRVGDTVTVGGVSGIVTRIRIRATAITDWNRKELIVPNKRFITEDVVNWTLSDPMTRMDIEVGIAYGSDTTLALKLMQEAARKVPGVLESPEPEVFFLGFGDNSLNFEVRAYVREMTNKGRTRVVHGVHMAVDQVFRENDIVISFPQRDLHIKSSEVPITIVTQLPNGEIAPIGVEAKGGSAGGASKKA